MVINPSTQQKAKSAIEIKETKGSRNSLNERDLAEELGDQRQASYDSLRDIRAETLMDFQVPQNHKSMTHDSPLSL